MTGKREKGATTDQSLRGWNQSKSEIWDWSLIQMQEGRGRLERRRLGHGERLGEPLPRTCLSILTLQSYLYSTYFCFSVALLVSLVRPVHVKLCPKLDGTINSRGSVTLGPHWLRPWLVCVWYGRDHARYWVLCGHSLTSNHSFNHIVKISYLYEGADFIHIKH